MRAQPTTCLCRRLECATCGPRMKNATALFHVRISKAFADHGRLNDSRSALEAAERAWAAKGGDNA